jgi:hypothetical protein
MAEQAPTADNAIELRIEEISQLFHTLDPFPFREKDLDADAEEFIVSWAEELPSNQPLSVTSARLPFLRRRSARGVPSPIGNPLRIPRRGAWQQQRYVADARDGLRSFAHDHDGAARARAGPGTRAETTLHRVISCRN